MAPLIPDEKFHMLLEENFSLSSKNAVGYHPGPVAPSAADPAPLRETVQPNISSVDRLSFLLVSGQCWPKTKELHELFFVDLVLHTLVQFLF